MRIPSLLGWLLMGAAFIAAAAETVAHSVPGVGGLLISAYDLWYTFSPKGLVIARIMVERDVHPIIWDPLLITVLQFPAWLLLGGPGVALAWFFRPPRPKSEEIVEASMVLYDRLMEAAEKEQGPEEPAHESSYDPSGATLVADTPADDPDFDPTGATQESDDGPYEPGGDGDDRA